MVHSFRRDERGPLGALFDESLCPLDSVDAAYDIQSLRESDYVNEAISYQLSGLFRSSSKVIEEEDA